MSQSKGKSEGEVNNDKNSWKCACGKVNFPSNFAKSDEARCYACSCPKSKGLVAILPSRPPAVKMTPVTSLVVIVGEWFCKGCKKRNKSHRTTCCKCQTSKD